MRGRDPVVFKVLNLGQWAQAEAAGRFNGAPVDLSDGYIHFSTKAQLRETVAKHFKGLDELVVVAVDADMLGDALVYEPSRGGDLFPHLYGVLALDAVLWVRPLVLKADGSHVFPDLEAMS